MQGGASRNGAFGALAIGLALLLVTLAITKYDPASTATADTTAAAMSFGVSPASGCDQNPGPTSCSIAAGNTFTLSLVLNNVPGGSYAAFQTELFYDGLTYEPDTVGNEIVWPQSASPVRFPSEPDGNEGLVAHGDVTALQPPMPASNFVGELVKVNLTCPQQAGQFTVAVLPYSQDRLLGAGFKLVDQSGNLGATVPAKIAGQRVLDLDGAAGAPTAVNVAAAIDIGCGVSVPTATPNATATNTAPANTATRTATRTPTRTRTPTPRFDAGDVNCDEEVDSIDAALVLQKDAGLIDTLECEQNADVNEDGEINSIDAAVILQFVAGLIGLPV